MDEKTMSYCENTKFEVKEVNDNITSGKFIPIKYIGKNRVYNEEPLLWPGIDEFKNKIDYINIDFIVYISNIKELGTPSDESIVKYFVIVMQNNTCYYIHKDELISIKAALGIK